MSSKRYEHWRAFDEGWFARHQALLLWLINGPFRWLIRWMLRMRDNRDIHAIGPNRHIVSLGGRRYEACFYSHWKYSKRLYFSLKPLWWLMHAWDGLLPASLETALGFGFDTLTTYPDPDPETSTVDGFIRRWDIDGGDMTGPETLAVIRVGTGTYANSAYNSGGCMLEANASLNYDRLQRVVALFNTSALGSSTTINSASLYVYISTKGSGLGSTSLELVNSNPASNTNLVASDFTTLGTTSYGSLAWANVVSGQYCGISLNSSGLNAISKTGVTKLGLKLGFDLSGSGPTWAACANTSVSMYLAEQTGASNDEYLSVVYTPPITSKSASDSGSLAGTEASGNTLTSSRSDSGSLAANEASGNVLTSGLSDSGSLSVAESTANLLSMARADSGSVSATEAANTAVLVLLAAVDSGLMSAQEISNLVAVLSTSDSGALAGTENTGNALWSTLVEAGVLTADDIAQISGAVGVSDIGSLSVQDTAAILAQFLASDTGNVAAVEAAIITAITALAANDSGFISAVESALCQIIELPAPSSAAMRVNRWLRPAGSAVRISKWLRQV